MIKIDKGVPIPIVVRKSGAKAKYPIRTMEVGDSFFIPNKTAQKTQALTHSSKPKKFTARSVVEDGVKGARIWRIE